LDTFNNICSNFATDGTKDITEIKLNVERLEHHFRIYKKDMTEVKDFMQEVKIALAGSNINGNKGLIQPLDKLKHKS
jgi:hypothetical protein